MTSISETVARGESELWAGVDRARRAWLIARIRLQAAMRRSQVELDIAPDLRVGRGVVVKVAPRTKVVIRIAPRCRIGDGVLLFLTGGSLVWEEDVQLRLRSSLNLAGDLWCGGGNIFSYGTIIHCVESIRLAPLASCAEYTTIADSAHFFTEPDVPASENTAPGPISIGRNVFLAPRVSVNRGVTIGDYSIVGPNSVVIGDLPSGSFASGVPAQVVRSIDLPWEERP